MDKLDEYDENDDRGDHDFRTEALVAVADGKVTKTAAADGTGHGRFADQADDDGRKLGRDAGPGLGQQDLPDDLEGGCAHGLSGLDKAVGNLFEGGFDLTADERNRGEDERDHGRRRADRAADDETGQRDDGDHQDDERDRADGVDDRSEHAVEGRCCEDLPFAGGMQQHAERDADDGGDDHRDDDHVDRLAQGLRQQWYHVCGHSRSPPP